MSAALRVLFLCLLIQFLSAKPRTAELANIQDFPFMAAILDDDMDEFLGMAVIVSKNVIFSEEITWVALINLLFIQNNNPLNCPSVFPWVNCGFDWEAQIGQEEEY